MKQAKVVEFGAPKKNCTWMRRDKYPYAEPITDEDRIKLGNEITEHMLEIEQIEYSKKQANDMFKEQLAAEQYEIKQCAKALRTGKWDSQLRDCDVYQDWDSNEIVYITHDEERLELHRRPMTEEERQPTLFDEAPDATQDDDI